MQIISPVEKLIRMGLDPDRYVSFYYGRLNAEGNILTRQAVPHALLMHSLSQSVVDHCVHQRIPGWLVLAFVDLTRDDEPKRVFHCSIGWSLKVIPDKGELVYQLETHDAGGTVVCLGTGEEFHQTVSECCGMLAQKERDNNSLPLC